MIISLISLVILLSFILAHVFQPKAVESIVDLLFKGLSNANLDISNLAIVFFTLILVWIEYRRYRMEHAHPIIKVSYFSRRGSEFVFKVFIMNLSKMLYIFSGYYFIPSIREGSILFRKRNPLTTIEPGSGMYERIEESELGEEEVLVPRENTKEYFFTLPVDASTNKEKFFVFFGFKYLYSGYPKNPWEKISSYMGFPQLQVHEQIFLYFVDLGEKRAELIAQL